MCRLPYVLRTFVGAASRVLSFTTARNEVSRPHHNVLYACKSGAQLDTVCPLAPERRRSLFIVSFHSRRMNGDTTIYDNEDHWKSVSAVRWASYTRVERNGKMAHEGVRRQRITYENHQSRKFFFQPSMALSFSSSVVTCCQTREWMLKQQKALVEQWACLPGSAG